MEKIKELIIATGNKNKLKEFQSILEEYILISKPVETLEIQGTANEVILEKAKQAFTALKKPCIVDDTSFGFVEWNGFPGPYIKDLVAAVGVDKFSELTKDKRVVVSCHIALALNESEIHVFEGIVHGTVVSSGGKEGFDFDRVFIPAGHNLRFSEMTAEEKNKISHRYLAILKLKEYLDSTK